MFSSFGEFFQTIMEAGLESLGLYYGVYRAKVINNADPDNLGRLIVHCEQVHGDSYPPVWSWPEAPYAGNGYGFWAIPDIGDYVYVRFDHGRSEKAIWHGGWWGDGDTSADMTLDKLVVTVKEGMKVVIDRSNMSVLVSQGDGNTVLLTPDVVRVNHGTAIEFVAPNIKMTGDLELEGNGNVSGNFYAANNSAHHTHPVTGGVAQRNNP